MIINVYFSFSTLVHKHYSSNHDSNCLLYYPGKSHIAWVLPCPVYRKQDQKQIGLFLVNI